MRFSRYLLALFVPPLYLYTRGRSVAGTVNLFVFGLAWLLLVTVVLAAVSPIPWLICALHAVWDVRRGLVEEHSVLLSQKWFLRGSNRGLPKASY